MIYTAAELLQLFEIAGDGSPGRQCTKMMTFVCVHQAYT